MAKFYVEDRQIVIPGDLLAEGRDVLVTTPYIYKSGDKFYATIAGLVQVNPEEKRLNLVPLEGAYLPRPGDVVIGVIIDVGLTYWVLDIKAPYTAILYASEALTKPFNPVQDDLRRYYSVGDYLVAKVLSFDRTKNPLLTIKDKGLGRITRGVVVDIKPSRTPRVVGKKGSMLNMLMSETGCNIVVGVNGRVWVRCPSKELEDIVVLAIKKIESEAYTTGLTDRVRMFIQEEKKRLEQS